MLPVYGANYTHRPPERPRTTGQPNNAPRQLEFGEAMNDFKHMFPTLDRDVIEAVLRANNGLVDATIDQLLSMGVDMQGSVSSSTDSEHHPLPSYSDLNESEPPPAYTPRESSSSRSPTASRPLPAKPYSAWNPPLLGKLPDDFLRLGPSTTPVRSPLAGSGDSMNDRELERFLEDEKLAMVLQNQEFMRELRHNKDFMLSLEKDRQKNTAAVAKNTLAPVESTTTENVPVSPAGSSNSGHTTPSSATPVSVEPVAGAVGGHPASPTHDDAVLREKLKHMGKSTRKKFDKLAKMFHRKSVNRANIIATGSAASTANLLDGYNDDDDDEMLNAMGSARLEILDERDEEKERKSSPQQTAKNVDHKPSEPEPRKPENIEPIVFFSEDNEFAYKDEK